MQPPGSEGRGDLRAEQAESVEVGGGEAIASPCEHRQGACRPVADAQCDRGHGGDAGSDRGRVGAGTAPVVVDDGGLGVQEGTAELPGADVRGKLPAVGAGRGEQVEHLALNVVPAEDGPVGSDQGRGFFNGELGHLLHVDEAGDPHRHPVQGLEDTGA